MRTRKAIWLLLLLLLAACDRQDAAPTATATPPATATAATATPRATATPQPTPTSTPTPAPPAPALTTIEQTLDEDGVIVISSVTVPEAGWVAVFADADGAPGALIGQAEVAAGEHDDVAVSVDPYAATPTLHARLFQDAVPQGEFDYPEGDEPFTADGEPVAASFDVDLRVVVPAVVVSGQTVTEDGIVTVDEATVSADGWVAVHADADGAPGPILGQSPIVTGTNEAVAVRIDWRQATRSLHAVLYADNGVPGRFEPDREDQPIALRGEPVAAAFVADLPPDVMVIDQPASIGEVYIDRALVNEPGWISVHSDFAGYGDRLLGYAPLEAGANENIVVVLDDTDVTPLVHVMLHVDSDEIGSFDYPRGDETVRDEGRMLLFSFQTDAGNYLALEDQPLGDDNAINVRLVVTDLDVWVVVQADDDGEPGSILGVAQLPPGVHRNVTVSLDDDVAAGDLLYVTMHLDAEEVGEFDYPDGEDVPLNEELSVIRVPFTLLPPGSGEDGNS